MSPVWRVDHRGRRVNRVRGRLFQFSYDDSPRVMLATALQQKRVVTEERTPGQAPKGLKKIN